MDTTDPDIAFDENGVCNHCRQYDALAKRYLFAPDEGKQKLDLLVKTIKEKGAGKEYDCVIGVSGGVDSTYLAYVVKELGLRPLAVHLDNGWNSELAVHNIEKVLNTLGIDLSTYVIDWEEFRDLQLSFLKASTPDGEVPSDHAIVAVLYEVANRIGCKYIILGTNVMTESVLPLKWAYGHADYTYIKKVHARFGSRKLKTYPHYGLLKLFYSRFIRGIKLVPILNYLPYNKKEAMELLQNKLGWVYYGGKHYESIYTRFYQAFILPKKFNIDKRKAHLSSLIDSGQLSREQALEELRLDTAPPDKLKDDRYYVIKKLGITENEFDELMNLPVKTFFVYPNRYAFTKLIEKIFRLLGVGR